MLELKKLRYVYIPILVPALFLVVSIKTIKYNSYWLYEIYKFMGMWRNYFQN